MHRKSRTRSGSESEATLFLTRDAAESSGVHTVVVPSKDRWNDFGYSTIADIGLRRESDDLEWFSGRFAVEGEESLREFADRVVKNPRTGVQLGSLGKPYASLLSDIKQYSLARRTIGSDSAARQLSVLHDIALLRDSGEQVPGWSNFFDSEVFSLSFVRSSESYLAFREGAAVLFGRATENTDSLQPFGVALLTGPKVRFAFEFDSQNLLRGRIAVLIGANGCGKTTSLALLARGLADTKSKSLRFEHRPPINQVLAFAHSGALAKFQTRVEAAGSAKIRAFALDSVGRRRTSSKTAPSDTRLLVEVARASDEEGPLLDYLLEVFNKEFPSLRMQVPVKTRSNNPGAKTYESLDRWMRGGEQRQLEAAAEVDHTRPIKYLDSDGNPRVLSLGQQTFIRFVLTTFANAGPASVLLIDEPENFLHPNLISGFMRVLHRVLTGTRSIALVATHSPFVVREVQRAQVHVIKQADGRTIVAKPRLQTLGANVATISDEVFSDDLPRHLHEELLSLAITQNMTFDSALDAFAHELSTEALMLLRSRMEGRS